MFHLNSMVMVTSLVFAYACTSDGDERLETADAMTSVDTSDSDEWLETADAVTSADVTEDAGDLNQEDVLQIPDTGPCRGASVGGACAPSGQSCGTYDECCCGLCTPSQTCICENGRFVCGGYADRCVRPECAE